MTSLFLVHHDEVDVAVVIVHEQTVAQELRSMGHDVYREESTPLFGRGQMIVRLDNGVLVGGTESRTDSNIACF